MRTLLLVLAVLASGCGAKAKHDVSKGPPPGFERQYITYNVDGQSVTVWVDVKKSEWQRAVDGD
jgi:uncharacterized protein YceK